MSSAGVVYTITRACSEGDLDTCHCDPSKQGQSRDLHGTFQWGGCSDNIRYALRFARSFMDAKDKQMKLRNRPDTRALMNLHNSRAGRRVSSRLGEEEAPSCLRPLTNQRGSKLRPALGPAR